ncbi:MAG: hypothetical protein PHW24_00525 [Candidatus Moranbacteria bacterium]|nr:hypothetical protein [Candidatus Moranbacteria bacterium]
MKRVAPFPLYKGKSNLREKSGPDVFVGEVGWNREPKQLIRL